MLIDIYRFSEDGFIPKCQHTIIDKINYWRNYDLNEDITPEWQIDGFKKMIEKSINFDIGEAKSSVFVFVGKPDYESTRLLLNHLCDEEKQKRKWYKAKLDISAVVYADSDVIGKIEHLDRMILSDMLSKCTPTGISIIIPECSINQIKDIQQINQL